MKNKHHKNLKTSIDLRGKIKVYFKAFKKIKLLFIYLSIAYHEWLYAVHLKIRTAHDKTYQKVIWYKNWTDKKYSSYIHKTVFASFILSFAVFSVFQTIFPFFNKPSMALADSHYIIWTTKGDFENNASTTDTPTQFNINEVNITGDNESDDSSVKLKEAFISENLVAVGNRHSVALMKDKTVMAWGEGSEGQLGNGTNDNSSVPVSVSNLTDIKQVSAGTHHSLALKNDGTVWAWGRGSDGQLGNGANNNSNIPVQVSDLTDIVQISAGYYYSLALKNDGTVWAWGANWEGYFGNGTSDDSNVRVQSNITDVKSIATGNYHSLALKNDGTVWAWGYGPQGQLGDNLFTNNQLNPVQAQIDDVTEIKGHYDATIALKNDGTVWAWGEIGSYLSQTENGLIGVPIQASDISNVKKIASVVNYDLIAIKNDNTVWSWSQAPTQINNLNGAISFSEQVESDHSIAVMSDGTLKSWGSDSFGQLGNGGENINSNDPIAISVINGETDDLSVSSRTEYPLGGSVLGLKATTGGPIATWNSGSVYFETPEGTSIQIQYRQANSEEELVNCGWYDANFGSDTKINMDYAQLSSWIEFRILLYSDGNNTPIIHDFNVLYDTIKTPTNITLYKNLDNTIVDNEWSNDGNLKLKADLGMVDHLSYDWYWTRAEIFITDGTIEFQNVEGTSEGITTKSEYIYQTEDHQDQVYLGDINGLKNNTSYVLRLRMTDGNGRVSAWSNPKNIRIDTQGPKIGKFIINENSEKTKQRQVNLNIDFDDLESGISQMRFSNDGQNWSDWENYQTEKAWNLSSGDGVKNVYAQAKDLAGNISGKAWDSDIDFNNNGNELNSQTLLTNLNVNNGISLNPEEVNNELKVSTTEKNKIAVNDNRSSFFIDINGNLYGSGDANGLGIGASVNYNSPWIKLKLPENKKAKYVYGNDCGDSVFVIAEDGTLYIAGDTIDYGLKDSYNWEIAVDQFDRPITDVKQLSAGYDHVLIIREDNKVWGAANEGEYLDESGDYVNFLRISDIPENVTQVAAACYGHSMVLSDNGILRGIGGREIGLSSWSDSWVTLSGGWNGVKNIGAGSGNSFVEDNDGYIWVTGAEYRSLGIPYNDWIAGGQTWIKNGIQNPKSFEFGGDEAMVIDQNDNAFYTGYCRAFTVDPCPVEGSFIPFDSPTKYFNFEIDWNQALGVDIFGNIYAWGNSDDVGFPSEGKLSKRSVTSGVVSFLSEGYLGSVETPNLGLIFSNRESRIKPVNINLNQDKINGSNIKFAYRLSSDGLNWSELKGRNGQEINWETNYIGIGDELINQISSFDVDNYIEIVVKLESDGTVNSYLDSLILETAFTNTIILETEGPEIIFDPNNKYPNENWNVRENINSIEFRFQSDKDSIAYVGYGLENITTESHGEDDFKTSHVILLKNLLSNTNYRYRIRLFDELGNMNILPNNDYYEAKTTMNNLGFEGDPLASNLSQVEITASVAKITWKTMTPTTSWVDYGLDSNYGNTAGDDNLTTTHVVELKNLVAGKTYMYRVRGLDSGENEFISNEFSFKAIMKPLISNVKVDKIDSDSAEVSWTTNVKTDSDVAYGETTTYSNRTKDQGYLTIHSVMLENLSDDVTYHFQVEARDEYGNATKSEDYSFKTPLDTAGPKIENVRIDIVPIESDDTSAQIIVSWKTNKPSTAKIEYGEGLVGGKYEKGTIEDTSLNYSHTSIIKELRPATSYHFRIVSKDKRNNKTSSHDYNIVTPAKQKSIWQLILKAVEDTFSWVKDMPKFWEGIGKKV